MSRRLPVNKGSYKVKGIPKSLKTSRINHSDSICYYQCAQIPVQETVLSLEAKKLSIQGFLAGVRNGTRVWFVTESSLPWGFAISTVIIGQRAKDLTLPPPLLESSARHLHWKRRVRGLIGKIHTFIDTGQKMEGGGKKRKRERKHFDVKVKNRGVGVMASRWHCVQSV